VIIVKNLVKYNKSSNVLADKTIPFYISLITHILVNNHAFEMTKKGSKIQKLHTEIFYSDLTENIQTIQGNVVVGVKKECLRCYFDRSSQCLILFRNSI
jgi:hypothetical protein